ncbi:MAG: (Fe-S)-binding protein [Candidatus Lokiarchaeota archaeon]|nr:(Fe-S)-binding protein [Candidatus Lokiarchaeota archaeon]
MKLLYFGCMAQLRVREILDAILEMHSAGILEGKIINEEPCCGSVLIRTGNKVDAKINAEKVYAWLKKNNIDEIIAPCAGCANTFREEYPKLIDGFDIKVKHLSQELNDLVKSGKLKLTGIINKKITYHDPCHLGRGMEIYEEPRELLKSIPGVNFTEMKRSRNHSRCCGAGGGVLSLFSEVALGPRSATETIFKEIKSSRAKIIVTNCVFCYHTLKEGKKLAEKTKFDIIDLPVLINKMRLGELIG